MNDPEPITESSEEKIKKDKKPDNFPDLPKELGGRKGPEPTRYGDWEKDGIVSDF